MFRLATYSLSCIVLVAAFATEVTAQVSGGNSKVITWQYPANTTDIYVGILGEVGRPGVYHLDQASLTLQSVIRRAGGLTEGASFTIRIVRGDRVAQSIFFNPQTEGPLIPGDLLIVESKRSQAAVSKMVEGDPRLQAVANYGADQSPKGPQTTGVQLALLNVLDRPVFAPVKHEDANLLKIVQKLGQPIELAQAVRVISPERLLSQATTQPINEPIADGSVLVFPRGAVVQQRLPSLLSAYEGIAQGAMPSLIGARSGQSAELRNVGQLPPLMSRQTIDPVPPSHQEPVFDQAKLPAASMSPTATDYIPPLNPPTNTQQIELPAAPPQVPLVSSPPRIATVPFSGAAPIKTSSTITSSPFEPLPADPREPARGQAGLGKPESSPSIEQPSSLKSNPSRASSEIDLIEDPIDEAPSNANSSSITLKGLFGVVACVGMLIGIAIATRKIVEARSQSQLAASEHIHQAEEHATPASETNTTDSSEWSLADVIPASGTLEESSSPQQPSLMDSESIHDPELPAAESFSSPSLIQEIASTAAESQMPAAPVSAPTSPTPLMPIEQPGSQLPAKYEKSKSGLRTLAESASAGVVLRGPAKSERLASRLDQLIHNELPIRQERVEFPSHIVLQGRIVPPPVFRVDPKVADPISHGPHFELTPAPVEQMETKVIIVPEANVITDEVDGSHSSGPTKPHFMRRRAGEKTVAAAAAATAKSTPSASPESKSSSTPLTDALRQLQGGQP